MYRAREQGDILRALQERSKTPASKIEGTFEYDVLASNSIEFGKVEVELEEVYRQSFGTTATDEYLTMKAAESGVFRKKAVKAHGLLTVTGSGLVRKGSLFATEGGIRFVSIADSVIASSGKIEVEAVDAGAIGNTPARTITKIPFSIPGISAVTNEAAMQDGYDEEEDEALRDRYLEHVRYPGASGNKRHYIEWATSVPGIGTASCIRAWNGANTVKVVVSDANYTTVSESLIKKVYERIAEQNPINAIVTIVSATIKTINIEASVRGQPNADDFKQAVQKYFREIARSGLGKDNYVSIAKIGALLLQSGAAQDYDSLTLNGAAANVSLTNEELPALGRVVLHG